jgi:hypothetical protein
VLRPLAALLLVLTALWPAARRRPPVRSVRRPYPAPLSGPVTRVVAVLALVIAGAAVYDIYRIGDSGSKAAWTGNFSSAPGPGAGH